MAYLTACGSTPPPLTVSKPVYLKAPEALLTCAGEPQVPGPKDDDNTLANFVLDLKASGADCRGKLLAVKGLQDKEPQ